MSASIELPDNFSRKNLKDLFHQTFIFWQMWINHHSQRIPTQSLFNLMFQNNPQNELCLDEKESHAVLFLGKFFKFVKVVF